MGIMQCLRFVCYLLCQCLVLHTNRLESAAAKPVSQRSRYPDKQNADVLHAEKVLSPTASLGSGSVATLSVTPSGQPRGSLCQGGYRDFGKFSNSISGWGSYNSPNSKIPSLGGQAAVKKRPIPNEPLEEEEDPILEKSEYIHERKKGEEMRKTTKSYQPNGQMKPHINPDWDTFEEDEFLPPKEMKANMRTGRREYASKERNSRVLEKDNYMESTIQDENNVAMAQRRYMFPANHKFMGGGTAMKSAPFSQASEQPYIDSKQQLSGLTRFSPSSPLGSPMDECDLPGQRGAYFTPNKARPSNVHPAEREWNVMRPSRTAVHHNVVSNNEFNYKHILRGTAPSYESVYEPLHNNSHSESPSVIIPTSPPPFNFPQLSLSPSIGDRRGERPSVGVRSAYAGIVNQFSPVDETLPVQEPSMAPNRRPPMATLVAAPRFSTTTRPPVALPSQTVASKPLQYPLTNHLDYSTVYSPPLTNAPVKGSNSSPYSVLNYDSASPFQHGFTRVTLVQEPLTTAVHSPHQSTPISQPLPPIPLIPPSSHLSSMQAPVARVTALSSEPTEDYLTSTFSPSSNSPLIKTQLVKAALPREDDWC